MGSSAMKYDVSNFHDFMNIRKKILNMNRLDFIAVMRRWGFEPIDYEGFNAMTVLLSSSFDEYIGLKIDLFNKAVE